MPGHVRQNNLRGFLKTSPTFSWWQYVTAKVDWACFFKWIFFSVLGEKKKNVKGETGSTCYSRTVCIIRRIYVCFEIRQSREHREGGGDLNNQHTLAHTHKHTRLPNQVTPPERKEMIRKSALLLIWTEKKHLRYIFTPKIHRRPGCSNDAYLNSATMWHYMLSQRHMFYIRWLLHFLYHSAILKEKPLFHINMLTVAQFLYWQWSCDYRQT